MIPKKIVELERVLSDELSDEDLIVINDISQLKEELELTGNQAYGHRSSMKTITIGEFKKYILGK